MATATKPRRKTKTGDVTPDTVDSMAAAEIAGLEWRPASIGLDRIDPHPENRQVRVPDCAELAESIRTTGLLERVKVRAIAGGAGGTRYQMISGQRRWTAHQILGWESIEAEVCECSDAVARLLLTACNTNREDLDPIEKALDIAGLCKPADQGGAGLTREAAAKLHGLKSGQSASQLVRLLELPEEIQEQVAAGVLPESFARLLVPYLPLGKALVAWVAKEVKTWDGGEDRPTRAEFHGDLKRAADRELSRPMKRQPITKNTREWELASRWAERLFEPSPAEHKRLGVVEIPNGKPGQTVEVATNCKLWDRLQKKALPEAKKRLEAVQRKASRAGKGKPTTGPSSATAAELKQEKARKEKEAAEKLAAAVEVWARERMGRYLIAAAITGPHDEVPAALLAVQAVAERKVNEYRNEPAPHAKLLAAACRIQANAHGAGIDSGGPRIVDDVSLRAVRQALRDSREDPVTAAEELQAVLLRLYIWPQAAVPVERLVAGVELPRCWEEMTTAKRAKLRPVELLSLPAELLAELAEIFGCRLANGWKLGAVEGTVYRELVREFFELHSSAQLDTLASELCGPTTWASGTTRADKIEWLLNEHQKGKELPLPACFVRTPKGVKVRKGGRK